MGAMNPVAVLSLADRLRAELGAQAVRSDDSARALAAHDIFFEAEKWPALVFLPDSVHALARGLALLTQAGLALAPRGGGMSYTGGYLPGSAGEAAPYASVDLTRLNRVVDVNTEDLFITVQAGCTWAQVRQALQGTGLTTPYAGPLSGLRATVGGALSQNSMFFGAGQHGTAAETVLGLRVVLADGSELCTGSAGLGASPFARWGGPDLTGLLLGDCGALAVKAEATLRLIPAPLASGYASYGFPGIAEMVQAQVALIRAGLGSESFGIDAYKARNSAQTGNKLTSGVKTLTEIARSGSSLMSGLKAAAGVALTGTDYLDVHPYSIHLALDGDSPAHVQDRLARVANLCAAHNGTAQPASVPQVLRAQPFQPLRSVLAHNGDRWVPVHGVLPLSQALACVQAVEALICKHQVEMAEQQVMYSPLTANLDRAFLFEPCFYWPDVLYPLHVDVLGQELTAPWQARPRRPAATALVQRLWRGCCEVMDAHGAVHFQIGRAYPHASRMQAPTLALLQAIKRHLDPSAHMNPGALGLGPAPAA
jgi:FAD/FMN-containing dehydrogenase